MRKNNQIIPYELWDIEELSAEDRALVEAAKSATAQSYAPYSAFHVGSALRLSTGDIYTGNNQENASYPCGTCAERALLHYVQANFPQKSINAMAIAAETKGNFTQMPLPPCGLCRQALLEAEQRQQKNISLLMYGTKQVLIVRSIAHLLPFQFNSELLA
ncbi:MAG: cytidine deaminase [Bacteroidaceae bacterium]|nr:cytidine deaminase [Bacteroidaceae bacterium]